MSSISSSTRDGDGAFGGPIKDLELCQIPGPQQHGRRAPSLGPAHREAAVDFENDQGKEKIEIVEQERTWFDLDMPFDQRLLLFKNDFLEWLKSQFKVCVLQLKSTKEGRMGRYEVSLTPYKFGRFYDLPSNVHPTFGQLELGDFNLISHGANKLAIPKSEVSSGCLFSADHKGDWTTVNDPNTPSLGMAWGVKSLVNKCSVLGFPLLAALPDWIPNPEQISRVLKASATNDFLVGYFDTGSPYYASMNGRLLALHFHLRYWAPYQQSTGDSSPPYEEGFELQRDGIKLWTLSDFALQEHRETLVMSMDLLGVNSPYKLVLFSDETVRWENSWMAVMDIVDKNVRVQMHEIQNSLVLDQLMFDRSFSLSKKYFTLLQFLRLASELVDRPAPAFKSLMGEFENIIKTQQIHGREGIEDTMHALRWADSAVAASSDKVTSRINRKVEEIKSLRDGLFSATALREATNSMALNRAIYIFTVVTVIYTPIGFMATFWALPFLNTSSSGETSNVPAGFTATFILIPLATYIASAIVAWHFSRDRGVSLDSIREKMGRLNPF